MGHSNISITMNWYAHASIDTAKSEVQRLIALEVFTTILTTLDSENIRR